MNYDGMTDEEYVWAGRSIGAAAERYANALHGKVNPEGVRAGAESQQAWAAEWNRAYHTELIWLKYDRGLVGEHEPRCNRGVRLTQLKSGAAMRAEVAAAPSQKDAV